VEADIEREVRSTLRANLADLAEDRDPLGLLEELGWGEISEIDPPSAARLLFEALGVSLSRTRAIDLAVSQALRSAGTFKDGPVALTVYPAPGTAGCNPGANGSILVSGIVMGPVEATAELLVPFAGQDGTPGVWHGTAGPSVTTEPISGWDDTLGWKRVAGTVELAGGELLSPGDPGSGGPLGQPGTAWYLLVSTARTALAQLLVTGGHKLVEIAVEHVSLRRQFGRPIGSYQAVQHALADAHVALEAADLATWYAWRAQDTWTAIVAKAASGRAHHLAAKAAQQVTGGMGMTWEFPLHRYVRRGAVLDALLGSSAELTRELGHALLDGADLPRLGGWQGGSERLHHPSESPTVVN
jgi:hypothetical protein